MIKVTEGQDPYNVIGKYIQDHITVIEDIIAVIEINGCLTNELFTVDENGCFIWEYDWYEGEKDIVLIDFFPVSEAKKSSAEPERKHGRWIHIRTEPDGNALYKCSECHKGEVHVPIVEVHYCWNCGARMDGEIE